MAWGAPPSFTVGEIPTKAKLQTISDDLTYLQPSAVYTTSYTPALTAATPPTLGSGSSATAHYYQIGKLVHYQGVIIFGSSGAAAGSGTYCLSLPVNASSALADAALVGNVYIYDSSAGEMISVMPFRDGGAATYIIMRYPSTAPKGPLTTVNQANPMGWSNSDEIRWSVIYEAA